MTIYYYCDPKWHDDERVPADYLVTSLDSEVLFTKPHGIATCREHVTRAMDYMLEHLDRIMVRRVNVGRV